MVLSNWEIPWSRVAPRRLQAFLGFILIYRSIILGTARAELWGPTGLAERQGELQRILFFTPLSVCILLGVQAAAGVMLFFGARTRIASFAGALSFWVLQSRLPELSDAGDYLTRHLLWLSILFLEPRTHHEQRPVSAALHNAAIFLVITQTCTIYLAAGLAKISTTEWQTGQVLAILQDNPLFHNHIFAFLLTFPVVARIVCITAALHQITWPVLLFTRGKCLSLWASIGFHAFIALFMGLPLFGLLMIALDLFTFHLLRADHTIVGAYLDQLTAGQIAPA